MVELCSIIKLQTFHWPAGHIILIGLTTDFQITIG